MGIACDDVVLIEVGKSSSEPSVVTVNCPDNAGLGCDLCRIILEFGLSISKGDFSTDGRWCYIVLWVLPNPRSVKVDWESLKTRLIATCPSCTFPVYSNQFSDSNTRSSPSSQLYLLKFLYLDRKGLLHDVTKVLCELELVIQRVKAMPTPDGKVLDLFFITDCLEQLHNKLRRDSVCEHLMEAFGDHCITCELQLAGPEFESLQGCSPLTPAIADELFGCEMSNTGGVCVQAPSSDTREKMMANITVDNLFSPVHTLLHIECVDQKGLFYDILRTSKDNNIWIAYGRFATNVDGFRKLDLFIQQTDGKKVTDRETQIALCSRLKEDILHPVRVTIVNRGPDTQLLVANPVELSGKGRPRVFYDVTFALKTLGIFIFSAEIIRHSTPVREWEVYRFLFDEGRELSLASDGARSKIVDRVRRTLMGWKY